MTILFCLLQACVLTSSISFAQTSHPQRANASASNQLTLVAIDVVGNKHYTRDQIISASGLTIGQTVSDDKKTVNEELFRQAASRVGSSGAFSDVSYQYEFSAKGTKIQLHVTESANFLAARFDNFVWFTDDDLIAGLKAKVPLFDGALPISGNILEEVAQVLQGMLNARSLPGTVEYLPTAKPGGGPIEAITYTISGVKIIVGNMEFPGAQTAELPELQKIAKPLQGQDYSRSMLKVQEQFNFLPIYVSRGYLKAAFGDPQAKTARQAEGAVTRVDVAFPVSPNRQYKLAGVQWKGNTALSTEKLQPLLHLRAGEPANAVQMETDMDAVRRAYGALGYINARVGIGPQMDDQSSQVNYILETQEGDRYRMGTFEVQGLDPALAKSVTGLWKLRTGDAYDNSYEVQQFLPALGKSGINLPRGLMISSQESRNESDKTVSLKLVFSAKKSS